MVKFQLSGTQVRAFTFFCLHFGSLSLCSFTRQYYISRLCRFSLTYPTFDSNPCKNSHAMHENNLISQVVKISRRGQN